MWRSVQNYPLMIIKYPPYLFHWFSEEKNSFSPYTVTLTINYLNYVKVTETKSALHNGQRIFIDYLFKKKKKNAEIC